jgi:hypothetical protein
MVFKFLTRILGCASVGFLLLPDFLVAQGCSDAGICTLNSFKPVIEERFKETNNEFKIGVSNGAGDNAISVLGANLSYQRKFAKSWTIDSKLTFLSQSGNGVSSNGFGDVFANLNYWASNRITLTGGLKIPLSKSDRALNGHILPMDYQSSLGTLDLILGAGYRRFVWQWLIAYQQPLTQNENSFFPESFAPDTAWQLFQPTNQFQRKGDILFRVSHVSALSEKVILTFSLLPVWHLGEDQFTGTDGVVRSIDGSGGLTVNGNVFVNLALSKSSRLDFNVGFPFVVRKSRPDGLTRGYVMSLEYGVKF